VLCYAVETVVKWYVEKKAKKSDFKITKEELDKYLQKPTNETISNKEIDDIL